MPTSSRFRCIPSPMPPGQDRLTVLNDREHLAVAVPARGVEAMGARDRMLHRLLRGERVVARLVAELLENLAVLHGHHQVIPRPTEVLTDRLSVVGDRCNFHWSAPVCVRWLPGVKDLPFICTPAPFAMINSTTRPKARAVSLSGCRKIYGVPASESQGDLRVQGDPAQEGHLHFAGHGLPASRLERRHHAPTVRAGEPAHVLDHPDHGKPDLMAELDALAHVRQRHFLRRSHDDGPVDAVQELGDAQGLVPGPRRGVDDQVVQIPPDDIGEELLDQLVLHGPAHDDGMVLLLAQKEPDGHHLQLLV